MLFRKINQSSLKNLYSQKQRESLVTLFFEEKYELNTRKLIEEKNPKKDYGFQK